MFTIVRASETVTTIMRQIGREAAPLLGCTSIGQNNSEDSVTYKFPKTPKGYNAFVVQYDRGSDTYTVRLYQLKNYARMSLAALKRIQETGEDPNKPKKTIEGVYADSLLNLLEGELGMYLTMRPRQ